MTVRKRRNEKRTTYGPACAKCGQQTPWPLLWNSRTKTYFKSCPKCRAERRRARGTITRRTDRGMTTRVDTAITLSAEERNRLTTFGTLSTTLTTNRRPEPPPGR